MIALAAALACGARVALAEDAPANTLVELQRQFSACMAMKPAGPAGSRLTIMLMMKRDGSIFGKSQLRNVRVADGSGVFLTSPNIKLDWSPGAWLDNKLHVDSLTAERVTLIRLPRLKPSTRKGPILPGFDIHVGELRIDRLDIGPAVGGKPRSGSVRGNLCRREDGAIQRRLVDRDGGEARCGS